MRVKRIDRGQHTAETQSRFDGLARMVRLCILMAAIVACALVPASASVAEIGQHTLTFDGRERIYFTLNPQTAAAAPLLVLLHGSGGNGLYMARLWEAAAREAGIALVAPNSLRSDAWQLSADGPDFIHEVVLAAQMKTNVDPRRIYLFGQSGGAVYALNLAMLEAPYFAAVAVHAGSWRRPEEFQILPFAQRKIPVAMIVGDQDEFFTIASVRRTERALSAASMTVSVTIVPGQHHWYNAETAPEINRSAWDFLKEYALDGLPGYVVYPHAR